MLPLVPAGAGNSPYQSVSAFAGNVLLISPEDLRKEGLLSRAEMPAPLPARARVDFLRALAIKQKALRTAWRDFQSKQTTALAREFHAFCRREAHWLDDYALFTVLEEQHGRPWQKWPAPLARRDEAALRIAAENLAPEIAFVQFAQFLHFRQLQALKEYAAHRGVHFIGDLPIFVACHSADVWAHPHLFKLDERGQPRVVAGVPPDMFARTGQLWGNPLYDWAAMRRDGYAWWKARLAAALRFAGKVRIDHFRGFAAAWECPARARDARGGKWICGPGEDFFREMQKAIGLEHVIAEDLGLITPDVVKLRDQFELPGMRVIQFGFDSPQNPHLPQNYVARCVAYTGTHDNDTTASWFRHLPAAQKRALAQLAPDAMRHPASAMLRLIWTSVADLAIAPMQDVLGLGGTARMNFPGRGTGNWSWRMSKQNARAWPELKELTLGANRRQDIKS